MGAKCKLQINEEWLQKKKVNIKELLAEEKEELFDFKSRDSLIEECLKIDKWTKSMKHSVQSVGRVGATLRKRGKPCQC